MSDVTNFYIVSSFQFWRIKFWMVTKRMKRKLQLTGLRISQEVFKEHKDLWYISGGKEVIVFSTTSTYFRKTNASVQQRKTVQR